MKFIESARQEKGFKVWKLANDFKRNSHNKTVKGKLIFATINDDNASSLKLSFANYSVIVGQRYINSENKRFSFKIKKDKIYVFQREINEHNVVKFRDVTVGVAQIIDAKFTRKKYDKNHKVNLEVPNKSSIARAAQLFNHWLKLNNFPRKFRLLKDKTFGQSLENFIYPNLKHFGGAAPIQGVSSLKESSGIKHVIKKCFGFDSKKITKLVCQRVESKKKLDVLRLGLTLKGLIPLDYFYPLLENKTLPLHRDNLVKGLRKFFKERPEPTRLSLLKNLGWEYVITDTIRMYNDIRAHITTIPKDIEKDWVKFHDWLTIEQRKIATKALPINYSEKELVIDSATVDDLEIELPKDTHKLIEWGQELSHCVGGYGRMAADKRCNILGVKKAGEIKYCIEINENNMVQFRGKHNCDPEPEDYKKVVNLLKEKQII